MKEFLQSSDNLLEEYELAVTEMRTIEKETESLKRRWNKLKSDANSREPRFLDNFQLFLRRKEKYQFNLLDKLTFTKMEVSVVVFEIYKT